MKRIVKWLVLASLALILLVFMIANRSTASMSLYPFPYEIDMPLFLVCIIVFLLGVCVGKLLGRGNISVLKRRAKTAEMHEKAIQKELDAVKADAHITHSLIGIEK